MLERAHGVTDAALEAIADLERRVVAADGGRLKLEWGVLRSPPTNDVRALLWWEHDELLGFLGIYGFGWPTLELAGMVDPERRRRGIGRALLEDALADCRARGCDRLLLVVPRVSLAGHDFAASMGAKREHSEHALTLSKRPADASADPALHLREATAADVDTLSQLFLDGFGDVHLDSSRPLVDDRRRTLMIDRGDKTIGTVAVTRDDDRGRVYGFVVASEWRGRGIGREALRRACRELFDAGAHSVGLEVEVANDRALGLYTSVGFEPTATEDYYELRLM
ncbi:MAG TPA: GNAT family N-acetyltransferase [Solirubrobacteraceae bacterium]|nr:GNAT family N-acetyltransferase [Solirubrobacteraceae bacterium]